MKIWVDADGCSHSVIRIVAKAAQRRRLTAIFVANRALSLPSSVYVNTIEVGRAAQEVDRYIAEEARQGDLAVTADIPLAARLVENGVLVLNPRGDLYDKETIGERLAMRNLMGHIRSLGADSTGPSRFKNRGVKRFAELLDRELSRR
jgi:uncharacterized protein YaiI (UPF0178 family)